MEPGGEVKMNVWCSGNQGSLLKAAFEGAGFCNVEIAGDSVGTMLYAKAPDLLSAQNGYPMRGPSGHFDVCL
jgi:hypothetical protein